jgi:23S rRNA pseudouridine1911/1915/1917 synthase
VHRLDKDTSGCILLAKNDTTHRWLQRQFRAREVEKIYHALVDGRPPTPKGRIEAAIGRDSTHRIKMSVVVPEKGRRAVTEYTTVETFERYSYLEVRPITGRTHQIRVHLAFLGCPVSGDRVYGGRRSSVPLERQFLHASLLRIRLLGDETHRTFQAALAPELAGFLADLRASGSSPPHV